MRFRNFRLKTQRGDLLTTEHPVTNYWILLESAKTGSSSKDSRKLIGQRGYRDDSGH